MMKRLVQLVLLISFLCVANYGARGQLVRKAVNRESEWTYQDIDAWVDVSSTCGGDSQSPIAINHNEAVTAEYPPFSFTNYDTLFALDMTDSGHTVSLALSDDVSEDDTPYFTGGGFEDTYQFYAAHIHWGSGVGLGSEHTVNSTTFEAEVHLVHYNTKYEDFTDALDYSDGLAVLGVLVKQAEETSLDLGPLQRLDQYFSADDELSKTVSLSEDESIPIGRLFPENLQNFYRYSGSLTTPSCNEVVTWTVFAEPITFSSQQMDGLRGLKNTFGDPLVNNFRPVQALNSRTVTFSRSAKEKRQ